MNKSIVISIRFSEEELALIDKASKLRSRKRSDFIRLASVNDAGGVLS